MLIICMYYFLETILEDLIYEEFEAKVYYYYYYHMKTQEYFFI